MRVDGTVFTHYRGDETEVTVALSEDKEAYTGIAAKAFLSCKTIQKLEIAGSVAEIGDWAFAHMQNLEVLVLPKREIVFGKKVFLNCGRLAQILVQGDNTGNPGLPFFLAASVRDLQQEELLRPHEAGEEKTHKDWMKDYDRALFRYLEAPDETGFDPVFFGWFKVEDIDDQMPVFLRKKRRIKAALILLRLLYPMHLTDENQEKLYAYVRAAVPSKEEGKIHTAVYDLFCEEDSPYTENIRYLQILKESGALDSDLEGLLLENMKNASAELRGYLLREKSEEGKKTDFFADFTL